MTLTEAYVDRSVNALKDARAAEITTSTVTIHAGGCAVELPDVEGIRQLGADSTILGGTLTIAGYGARRTGPSFVLTFNGCCDLPDRR